MSRRPSMDARYDHELARVWQLVTQLSEQLAVNQNFTATLQSQVDALKAEAAEAGVNLHLRRFNTDISKETFESELERTSAQIIIENQTLLHENKQLASLLKEYETTIHSPHAYSSLTLPQIAAQQHELTLTRHYETLLITRESQFVPTDLSSNANMARSFYRLSHHLRNLIRSLAGDDPDAGSPEEDLLTLDWASEREVEIARLAAENDLLRQSLGIDTKTMADAGVALDMSRISLEIGYPRSATASRTRRDPRMYGGPPPQSPWGYGGGPMQRQQPPSSYWEQPQQGYNTGAPRCSARWRCTPPPPAPGARRPGIFGAAAQRGYGGGAPGGLVLNSGHGQGGGGSLMVSRDGMGTVRIENESQEEDGYIIDSS
ncbi:hypothetical protein BD626DRAFT_501290 [Schizophyllum amplum]|uniref:Uncharacterized protein n=1 Tax=Schizophyllum amplum TaxID=97359 RepID=A0A550C9N9_9AGAR|nr:hypothetical protein BD626DRAFT_501290 [Auriculariopsis ampla]